MEDRKRSGAESHPGEPASKRQNVDRSSEEPSGPFTQDDVLTFQKEAIWRQMQVYKRERDLVQQDVDKIKSQYASLKSSFSTLDVWWDQLMDQLIPKLESEKSESNVPPTLLLNAIHGSDLADVLEKKNHMIKERLGPVLRDFTKTDAGKLQESLSNLSSMLHRLRAENDSLQANRDELSSKVEELSEKYLAATKKLDRQESSSLNKILKASTAAATTNTTTENNSGTATPAVETNGNGKGDENSDQQKVSQDVLREMETIKTGFEESQAIVEKQKTQLEEQDALIVDLKHRVQDFTSRLRNLPSDDLRNSDVFQSMRMKNEDLSSQVQRLKSKLDRADRENSDIRSSQERYKYQVRKDFEKEREALEKEKTKLEGDVTRIRQARDQILGDLNEKKAVEKDRFKSIDELQNLLNVREERIKTLEAEIERLKPTAEAEASQQAIDCGDNVDALKKLVANLQRQNKSLAGELPGMEQAYQQAHKLATTKVFDAVETENKLKKLVAEKSKADEKYFSAMRAKDATSNELNKVKQQLSKTTDALTSLREQEQKRANKIDETEEMVQKEKHAKRNREEEIYSLKKQLSEYEDHLKAATSRGEKLHNEIKSRDEQMQKENSKRRGLELQIEKLKRQVDTKQFLSGSGGVESQLAELRSMTLCSVCTRNFKDTAIKSCGHVLCNDCAQDRLNARLRKCPMCNKQYSYSDLLPIHL